MYCSKCGNEIKDGEEFCSKCGNSLNSRDTKNVSNKKIQRIVIATIAIIIATGIAIASISYVAKDIQGDKQRSEETLDDMMNSISFNCPYCKKRISINKNKLVDLGDSYTYYCSNCGKSMSIDKDTGKVTLLGY